MIGDEVLHELGVGDRPLDQGGTGRDRVGLAGEEVIEDRDAGSGIDETAGHRGTDEPGATRDEDAAGTERALERTVVHCFTPVRSNRAGRNSRHQSLKPRIFEYDSAR